MAEPLFFDCLTDAQFWSLFDAGILHGHMLPREEYERLECIASVYGCVLFTWPVDVDLPSLQDMAPSLAVLAEEPPAQSSSHGSQTHVTAEWIRSEIEVFCARVYPVMPPEGRRIHVISMNPRLELRAGPYLEPPARDLTAMSLPELEAYLDAVLRLDERGNVDSVASSASR
jgi:hypothetical protein